MEDLLTTEQVQAKGPRGQQPVAHLEKGLNRADHHSPAARLKSLNLGAQIRRIGAANRGVEADRECLFLVPGQSLMHGDRVRQGSQRIRQDTSRLRRRHLVGLQVSNLVAEKGQHPIRLEWNDMDANVDLALETE